MRPVAGTGKCPADDQARLTGTTRAVLALLARQTVRTNRAQARPPCNHLPKLLQTPGDATRRSQLPMPLTMIAFSLMSLWLLKQPMQMRRSTM